MMMDLTVEAEAFGSSDKVLRMMKYLRLGRLVIQIMNR